MKKTPIILDCDPGHDDAVALVLANASEKIDLRLVTTVSGNSPLDKITKNCLNVLNYTGFPETKVAMGYPYLMTRNYAVKKTRKTDEEIEGVSVHGKTGLDGFEFPEENPMKLLNARSVEAMAKVIKESDEKITVVTTGPLTNLALLIRTYPELLEKIEKVSMMGGTCNYILLKPGMEFNTYFDAEATNIVFNSGLHIDMYGYDVTYRVMYNDEILSAILKIGNDTSKMIYDLLFEFRKRHNGSINSHGFGDRAPIHDACAIAGIIDPSLVTDMRFLHGEVELQGDILRGATIFDYHDYLELEKNIHVVFDMDNKRFFELLLDCIEKCK